MVETPTEILIPFELQFSDLLLLSNRSSSSSTSYSLSSTCISRLESISKSTMEALGPSGPGLLSITGVPKSDELRRTLLPLSRNLALLGNTDRARILKEHGLGSDVPLKDPDRTVSSFAMQLKYREDTSVEIFSHDPSYKKEANGNVEENPTVHSFQEYHDLEFKHLGSAFKELGHCMMELGLQLAQVCDKAIGGWELEQSIVDSRTAKGRLIHYHSMVDNLILKEINRRSKGTRKKSGPFVHNSPVYHGSKISANKILPEFGRVALDEPTKLENLQTERSSIEDKWLINSFSNLWQQWHYDYGIFTVLTAPLFVSSCSQPCSSPDGHTYLQLFDATKNKILMVKSSPESFIIQVGESADILSGGRLRSSLHSVGRPVENRNLSRETFVVFLQPSWSKVLSYPCHLLNAIASQGMLTSNDEACSSKSHQLAAEILGKIPPLSSRLRDGMTFAEFSRETTKQYYGGSGTQSREKRIF